ncbi:MAG: hypothetical protein R8G66_04565 [Cytophagales bacterium]|nr:hypothetical protein [Cytophagales bacterium]
MKKLLAFALVLLVVASPSMASTGNGDGKDDKKKDASSKNFSIVKSDDNQFMLQVNSVEPGHLKVKILSEDNTFIHEQSISYDHSVKVPFDFSNLDEGNYKFQIDGADMKGVQEVFLSKMHEKDVAAFVQEIGDNKVKLTVYRESTPVTVSLIDEDGHGYYKKEVATENNFVQIFDLSDVQNKSMMLIIKGEKSTVSKVL